MAIQHPPHATKVPPLKDHDGRMSQLDTPRSTMDSPSAFTPLSSLTFSPPRDITPSPFPSTARKEKSQSAHILSMYSTQDRVILDIGARFLRAGFSGEAFPRCAIDALVRGDKDVFWDEGGWDAGLVEDRLERALREVYTKYLLIDSKARKVIVAEGTLTPYRIKEAFCRVLFTYFQVPTVTFLNSHVLALVSTGLRTGLVIDIGWHETRILPIFELRPLNPSIQVSPLGCKALHKRLTYLLTNHTTPPLSTPTFETIEDFLVRALYTLPTPPSLPPISTGLIPPESLHSVYEPQTPGTLAWFVPKHKVGVPRWIPACTPELFFEGDREGVLADTDEMGLVSHVMHCLARLPNHVRAKVIKGIVVVGGGAAIPGLRTRLRNDLQQAWDLGLARPQTPVSPVSPVEGELSMADLSGARLSALRFMQAEALDATFWGGSMLGDIKVRGLVEVTRDGFNGSHGRGVMDWSFIGGVGDDLVEEGKRRSR